MGLFDLFKAGTKGERTPRDEKGRGAGAAAKWADRAGDKRAQNYDRQEAIAALAELGTSDAVAGLLKRFTFVIDPSITDQDEKEAAFQGILKAGKDAIEPVRAFAAKAESLAWPMRVLKSIVSEDEYIEELLLWLSRWDNEYSKFIDPKLQLLVALEDHKHPRIREVVAPFLDDVNEPARFHAVATTFAQGDEAATGPLLDVFAGEESFRIKNRIADGLALRGWTIPEERRDAVRRALPSGFTLAASGAVQKRE